MPFPVSSRTIGIGLCIFYPPKPPPFPEVAVSQTLHSTVDAAVAADSERPSLLQKVLVLVVPAGLPRLDRHSQEYQQQREGPFDTPLVPKDP